MDQIVKRVKPEVLYGTSTGEEFGITILGPGLVVIRSGLDDVFGGLNRRSVLPQKNKGDIDKVSVENRVKGLTRRFLRITQCSEETNFDRPSKSSVFHILGLRNGVGCSRGHQTGETRRGSSRRLREGDRVRSMCRCKTTKI